MPSIPAPRCTSALRRAVRAFEAALLECTRERVPLARATAQNSLGVAFRGLGVDRRGILTPWRGLSASKIDPPVMCVDAPPGPPPPRPAQLVRMAIACLRDLAGRRDRALLLLMAAG
jgi:hypothetical protein